MENILPNQPEIIFGSPDSVVSRRISREVKEGKLRKVAPRIYTSNLEDSLEDIVNRNLFEILSNLYPEAIISHRSAFEYKPTSEGHIFLTYKYTKNIELPGVVVRLLKGPGPIEGDNPFWGALYASQKARAFLENLQISRRPGSRSKTLTLPEIEEKLDQIILVHDEEGLNGLRDEARAIAKKLGLESEFEKLNKLIGALLTTHDKKILKSPVASARALGIPYDKIRLKLFETLFQSLKSKEFKVRPDKNKTTRSFRNFAFFESYFSNYIEGTEFEIEEAKEIIRTNTPLPARSKDSHDVLGTYNLVSNKKGMKVTPATPDELIQLLKERHQVILAARTSKNPGAFKDKNNRAGSTEFVDFRLVKGTLVQSFELYKSLDNAFSKAVFMMFVVSEVHPFLDGNGRIARIMMNAELVKDDQSKIIIPTVYRDDYLGALRKLTRQSDPEAYIRMLARAFEFSETIHDDDMDAMQAHLEASYAFLEHDEGKLLRIIPKS